MIPHEYIEELTRRTDIVDLVGSYVQLKRKGRLYGGLCPFHSEKTPSFYVYPDTQSFYCFGCGAGGDAITFAKKINSISYGEAVKLLAGRAGMPEPQEDDKTGRMRSRILSMNKEAARFFHACLNSTVEEARQARAYWRRRGLDDKTIVRFGLGYAPNDGQALYQFLRDKGYNQQELDASGLFKRSQSGRIYCLFWKRVMTPIFDLRGNIIAFGGRVLDDSKPKYVNSPETLVYHKSETVFALQIAKKSASRRFVLCEGYMDVISMQQAGIDTAVCACGTALTPEQVRLISEYAEEVILSYDSDEAGQKATLRSLELFRNSPVRVGVLQIPGAKDPDEYIKKYGAERFQALLDGVGNALDFRLKRLRDQYDLKQDAQPHGAGGLRRAAGRGDEHLQNGHHDPVGCRREKGGHQAPQGPEPRPAAVWRDEPDQRPLQRGRLTGAGRGLGGAAALGGSAAGAELHPAGAGPALTGQVPAGPAERAVSGHAGLPAAGGGGQPFHSPRLCAERRSTE